jgi:hypothetical protein
MEDEKSPFTVVFGCHPPVTFHAENKDQDGDVDKWPVTVTLEPESTVHLPLCATTSTSDGGDSDVDGGSFDVAAVAAADEAGEESLLMFLLISKICKLCCCFLSLVRSLFLFLYSFTKKFSLILSQ